MGTIYPWFADPFDVSAPTDNVTSSTYFIFLTQTMGLPPPYVAYISCAPLPFNISWVSQPPSSTLCCLKNIFK
jgi:hypothetical protein